MTLTRIVRIHSYGGPEVLVHETVQRPTPADDELLVRVLGVGINPIDWKLREGYAKQRIVLPLPVALGTDISGTIVDKGDQVSGFAVGDDIVAMLGLYGAYADYVVVKASLAAPKPASLSHLEASSLPLAALTAWQGLFEHGGVCADQKVLVHAGAGSVGSFAIQLAASVGAKVITTASSANHDYVMDLGATRAIDYQHQDFEKSLNDLDMVLDLVGAETTARSLKVIKAGGILVQLVPSADPITELAEKAKVRTTYMTARGDGDQLRKLVSLVNDGVLKTHVGTVFPMSKIADAHELSRSGKARGKIVMDCSN